MFSFLNDLCESRLISSKTSLKNWHTKKLSELAYLYFLGLHILLCSESEKTWARDYCKKAGGPNDFLTWRSAQNDLYVLLYALDSEPDKEMDTPADIKELDKIKISPVMIRNWLRHVGVHETDASLKEETHKLFVRLDSMFHITDPSLKTLRRIIMDWKEADEKERQDTLVKVIQKIHDRAPSNSEILPHLKRLEAKNEKVEEVDESAIKWQLYTTLESASSGATGAASVATVVGGLGAGFDPNGDRGIYSKKKPVVIRRTPPVKKA